MMKQKPDKADNEISPALQEAARQVTNNAVKEVLADYIQDKKNERELDVESLAASTSEFLNSFIIIGYDLKGQPVNIIYAHNQQESDALGSAVRRFIEHNSR